MSAVINIEDFRKASNALQKSLNTPAKRSKFLDSIGVTSSKKTTVLKSAAKKSVVK